MRIVQVATVIALLFAFTRPRPAFCQGYPTQPYPATSYPGAAPYGGQPGYADPQQQMGGYQQAQYGQMPQQDASQSAMAGSAGGYGNQQMQMGMQQGQMGQMANQNQMYYGQAQKADPNWGANQMPAQSQSPGSYLGNANDTPSVPPPSDLGSGSGSGGSGSGEFGPEFGGGGGGGGAIDTAKHAAGGLTKMFGKAAKMAAPAASLYLMNKASGGRMMYSPMGMGGMGMGMGGMGMGMPMGGYGYGGIPSYGYGMPMGGMGMGMGMPMGGMGMGGLGMGGGTGLGRMLGF